MAHLRFVCLLRAPYSWFNPLISLFGADQVYTCLEKVYMVYTGLPPDAAVGVGGRGGPRWVSPVGGASEPGGAKCGRSPNQGPPDLSMGRVSAAGPSPGLWLPFRNCVEKGSM